MSAKQGDDAAVTESVDPVYTREVGGRLRAIRKQQGLSLQAVELRSEGRFKAVVVGSYERGDRVVSVNRLAELADFYGVPITELLPPGSIPQAPVGRGAGEDKIVINLRRLRELPLDQSDAADRYARTIQRERGDYGNDVLSLRADDLRPLAIMYGTTPEELLDRWRASGVVRGPVPVSAAAAAAAAAAAEAEQSL
jgi:transcriptional regulator with XRE-family HTH domain